MMKLDKEERALLALARDAHDPSDADRLRVRAALTARLGAAAGLGLAAGLGSSAKAAAVAGAGSGLGAGASGAAVAGATLGVKLIGAAVVVASTVGVGAVAIHHARRAPVAMVAASARTHARPLAAPAPALALALSRPSPPAVAASEAPPPASAPREVAPPVSAPREVAPPPPEAPGTATMVERPARSRRSVETVARASDGMRRPTDPPPARFLPTLAEEARLVRDGIAALRAGDPARALALFDKHDATYPSGPLAEECAAERALALADLGRVAEARLASEAFLRAHPDSPFAARLRERLRALDVRSRTP
jgi:hypothetical protein